MRLWEKLVSLACVSVIIGGAAYAYNRERLATTDLHQVYQELNRERFYGQLPDVAVEWGNLQSEEAYGETRQYQDGTLVIVLDRYSVTTENKLRETLHHEMAHVCAGVEHGHDEGWHKCFQHSKDH
jgi:hypothetical protein